MKATAMVLSIMVFLAAAQCWAGDSKHRVFDSTTRGRTNMSVKFALHLEAHGVKGCGGKTSPLPVIGSFLDIQRTATSIPTDGFDVFLVVFDYDSLSFVEYGMTWPSAWGSASTKVCVENPIPVGTINDPGTGMAIAWDFATACKIPSDHPGGSTPPFFVPSYSWIAPTGDGEFVLMENPTTGDYGVVDCAVEDWREYTAVTYVYDAGVNVTPYDGPPRTATETTSWGAIKALFK